MCILILTLFHTALCFIAIGLGIPAIRGLFSPTHPRWAPWFLHFATASSITGYLFPFNGVTPAIIVGVVALVILAVTYTARHYNLTGAWRPVYAIGMVASEYLLVFVLIAQSFQKVPFLHHFAPVGNEPAFAVSQLINLAAFVYLGYRAVKAFRSPVKR